MAQPTPYRTNIRRLGLLSAALLLALAAVRPLPAIAQDENGDPPPMVDPFLKQQLLSPQQTFRTFLRAINENRFSTAATCLDLSALPPETRSAQGGELAWKLKNIIDKIIEVDYSKITYDPQGRPLLDRDSGDASNGPRRVDTSALASNRFDLIDLSYPLEDDIDDIEKIFLARGNNGLWRFSAETVAAIENIYPRWKNRENVAGIDTSQQRRPFSVWLAEQFPEQLQEKHFVLRDYQWICLIILIFIGFGADLLVRHLCHLLAGFWLRLRNGDLDSAIERRVWRPIGLLVQALVWYYGTRMIGLPQFALDILLVGLKFFTVVAAIWTTFRFIDLIASVGARQALKTETKFDDLLIPLITRSLKAVVVCVGVLICAETFNLPLTGLLGGLGIGGAALAFASKDAVSNLFGSVTVLMDRPFEIGDWIVTKDAEGTVETVGFRSTRVRTFYNSVITVPNSLLTTAIVDNMGRRRYRRIKTMLGLRYDTTPEQIDAFCEGVREIIRRHPYTRKDYYHVYFNQFNESSLDVLLYCFIECPDWSVELRERHRLFVDILRLAKSLGIGFAFPTRTLHMHQEDPPSPSSPPPEMGDSLHAGRLAAAKIAGPAIDPEQRPGGVEFTGPNAVGGEDEE